MATPIINALGGGVLNGVAKILDAVIPDKTLAAQAKANLLQAEVQGEINQLLAQTQTNTAEASSKSTFVAGWRPLVGWVCGLSLAWNYIALPMTVAVAALAHSKVDFSTLPKADLTAMLPILMGMLGLDTAHAYFTGNSPSK